MREAGRALRTSSRSSSFRLSIWRLRWFFSAAWNLTIRGWNDGEASLLTRPPRPKPPELSRGCRGVLDRGHPTSAQDMRRQP